LKPASRSCVSPRATTIATSVLDTLRAASFSWGAARAHKARRVFNEVIRRLFSARLINMAKQKTFVWSGVEDEQGVSDANPSSNEQGNTTSNTHTLGCSYFLSEIMQSLWAIS